MTREVTHISSDVDIRSLPAGTELLGGQYRIDSYLSSGGFGITYLATDSLNRRVVIKECFPEALCSRTDRTVRARSSTCTNEFNAMVDMFVREARSLAKLDHPNIVGVHQIFEDNDTAYMALDFIDGKDVLHLIEDGTATFTPEQIVDLAWTLLGAISDVHAADMLHRDISPDNILIDQDNQPCLIDFGAARQEATKKSRAISALMVVKDGYSPQEFYISGGQQGPASDLYSLAATLYHLIKGEAPPNSQNRLAALAATSPDPYEPLVGHVTGYEPSFLQAIDLAMSVFPKDRPQSANEWIAIVDGTHEGAAAGGAVVPDVISNLVNEVARSIAEDTEEEALRARATEEAKTIKPVKAPEEDRWWPLTEPCEEVAVQVQVQPEPEPVVAETVENSAPPAISRKTRRRIGALVLIAALTVNVQDAPPDSFANSAVSELRTMIETAIGRVARV